MPDLTPTTPDDPEAALRARLEAVMRASVGQRAPGAITQAWRWANTPLLNVPNIEEQFDPETGTTQPAPGGGSGGDMVSSLSTPLSIGTTLGSLGGGAASRAGYPAIARAGRMTQAGIDALLAGLGGSNVVQGVREGRPGQALAGAAQAGVGGMAMRSSVPYALGPQKAAYGTYTTPSRLLNDTTAEEIVQATWANDGHSSRLAPRAPVRGDLFGTEGHTVGIFPETAKTIPPGQFSAKDLHAFVRDRTNNRLLQDPTTHLGTWHVAPNEATASMPAGSVVLDVGVAPPQAARADRLMRDYGQKAAFDLKQGTLRPNPDFVEPQPTSYPRPYPARLRDAAGKPPTLAGYLRDALRRAPRPAPSAPAAPAPPPASPQTVAAVEAARAHLTPAHVPHPAAPLYGQGAFDAASSLSLPAPIRDQLLAALRARSLK